MRGRHGVRRQRRHAFRCGPAGAPAEGSRGVLYPGEIEHMKEQDRRKNGIDVEDATWTKLKMLAEEYKLLDQLGMGDVE